MVPPRTKGQVTYADGTEASVDQMAKDVTAFLVWTAEPKLIKRIQVRSEEHTSELQSLMRNSYAVFCLKKKRSIKRQERRGLNTITTDHNPMNTINVTITTNKIKNT